MINEVIYYILVRTQKIADYQYGISIQKYNNYRNTMDSQPPSPIIKEIAEYRYSSADLLGSGSFSKVYKGVHTKTGEEIAIKVIDLKKMKSGLQQKLLSNEIKAVKTISHPNVINIIEVYQTSNNIYFVSEFCEGDLTSVIKSCNGPMEQEQIVKFMQMMFDGIEALHKKAIIHRDIKPANFLVKEGILKVADLGFCDFLLEKKAGENYGVGSPLYMSPEAYRKSLYSFKSDVWACGISIYQLILGEQPFKGMSYDGVIKEISQPAFFQQIKTSNFLKVMLQGMLRIDLETRMSLAECKMNLQMYYKGEPIINTQRPSSQRYNNSVRPQSPGIFSNRPLSSHRSNSNSSTRSIKVVISRVPSVHKIIPTTTMPMVYTPAITKQHLASIENYNYNFSRQGQAPRKVMLHNLFPRYAQATPTHYSPIKYPQKLQRKEQQTNHQLIHKFAEEFVRILGQLSKNNHFNTLKLMINQQCKLFLNKLMHAYKVKNLDKGQLKLLINKYHSISSQMNLSPSKDNIPKSFYHRDVINHYKNELQNSIKEIDSPEGILYHMLNKHLSIVNMFVEKKPIKVIEEAMIGSQQNL